MEIKKNTTPVKPTEPGLYFAVVKPPQAGPMPVPGVNPLLAGQPTPTGFMQPPGLGQPPVPIVPKEAGPYDPWNAIVELIGEAPFLEINVLCFGDARAINVRPRKWQAKDVEFGPKIGAPDA